MIITEILARNARMYGDQVALIEREPEKKIRREITWREFDHLSNKIANSLIDRGIKKGDKVILLMVNCLEWLPIYFGILRTGAWAVPLNFRFTAKEIRYCANIAEADFFFFGPEFIERMAEIKEDLKTIKMHIFIGPSDMKPEYTDLFEDFIETSSEDQPRVETGLLDEAALYFTSGTTGDPKPICLTQRNLEFACYIENYHHRQVHNDNFLCIPPLYHTGAKMHWFGNFIVGARAVILKGIKPQWILEAVSEEKATIVWLLVPWAQDILIAIEKGEVSLADYQLDQWRLMHIGAQPVPASLVKRWKEVFPHHDYDTTYGLSESTGPGCVHLGMENLHKVGAIGRPGFDWECKIVDHNLKEVPQGTKGELIIKGPGLMKCYYKNEEATKNTLVDGWLLTGDMARYDEEGFIWLVDRKKDVVIMGGENIYPVEVEDYLMGNENIQDVAVIGIPDERLGEIPAAVIQPKAGVEIEEEEIMIFCQALPRYKRPRLVFFDQVPRNPTGKIEKPKLREKYAGMSESFKN